MLSEAQRDTPAEGRRPEGKGANLDRRFVPYHGKCKRIQSRIELYICITDLYNITLLETGVIIIVKAEAEVERKSAKRGVRTETCFVLLLLRASAERDCEL